jgi:exosortase F-associated protein
MNKWIRFIIAGLMVFGLILVRAFETKFFYDPFLAYFKGDFYHKDFPDYDLARVIWNVSGRFLVNSVLSVLVIWFLFWNKKYVKYAVYILIGFFIVLLPTYIILIENEFKLGENFGFYIRRFLIQPYLLLILIPAFYYHQQKTVQNS